MTRTLLLDLDGTLVHSVPDLAAALNRLMAARGLAGFSQPETASMVGDGVAMLIERAFAARGRTPDEGAVAAFSADYGAACRRWTAGHIRASPMACGLWPTRAGSCGLHQQAGAAARALLSALGLASLFAAIGGGDSFPVRKPDPAHLLATLTAAGGEPAHAVMAGDHANDVAAARGAGVPCIFAAWGYGPPSMAEGAVAVAQDFAEMVTIARRLLAWLDAHRPLPAARQRSACGAPIGRPPGGAGQVHRRQAEPAGLERDAHRQRRGAGSTGASQAEPCSGLRCSGSSWPSRKPASSRPSKSQRSVGPLKIERPVGSSLSGPPVRAATSSTRRPS